MSEETPPAKKAARKSVRKKSATKRAPRKSAKSESENSDGQLPLEASSGAAPPEASPQGEAQEDAKPARSGREPRSGVRDARRETAGDPIPAEISEKLVPDDEGEKAPQEKPRQNNRKESRESSDEPQKDQRDQRDHKDQGKQDQNERRGRGRGRGGRDRDRERERPEKREPKARVSVNSKDLAKKAWKIFESEVTEEGLALLDDNGLRDYARSSFNAARLFLEEKGRVVGRSKPPKGEKDKHDKNDD